jgi:P4 family phage/plasmid primase-like protien
MSIFKDNAPAYWNAGLPVMPLKKWNSISKGAGKAPILSEWTSYGENMPSSAVRQMWLDMYPDSNIGLPFGSASGLCAIDIDTEDQAQIDAILAALPPSPWVRVGKKGMGLIYKWKGQANFKLRDGDNKSIVEFLGKGNQMVMPPSIHPDTEKPYTSNTNLWEVLERVPALPEDIEAVLRKALGGIEGLSIAQTGRSTPLQVVPQGERDIQMVRHAGYLARVVQGIDKNERFSLSDAMKHMAHWVETFTAHTAGGDDMDPEKGVAKLVEFLLKDVEGGRTLPDGWDAGLTEAQRAHVGIAKMIEMNEVQRWTGSKAKDWLAAQIGTDPGNDDWCLGKMWELIDSVARDENFKERDFRQLTQDIIPLMKPVKVSKTDLVRAFKEARSGESDQAEDHEAIARQVLEEMNRDGEIRWDQGKFWQWNGSCFKALEMLDAESAVAVKIKGNPLARRHNDYVSVAKTMAMLARAPLAQELEIGINFANGFLDANLELHDHSPKYGKTFTLPFNYVKERAGEAHKWEAYLEQVWGDDEDYADKVAALQEAFAATMFGMAPKFQRAFLLYGKGGSGKSQALEILRALMPADAQCSVPPTLWHERFQTISMVGKTLNICGEMPESAVLDGRMFKTIVEGGVLQTEFKGGQLFDFDPIAAHWFASNFLVRSRDGSNGFMRRWLILDFNRPVAAEDRIIDFHKILIAEEREAIAAWAVQALPRLLKNRDYTLPASHKHRINQVLRSCNSAAAFLQSNDLVVPTPGATADGRGVYDQYVNYQKTVVRGWVVPYESFIQMLEELGHNTRDYVDGIGMRRQEITGLALKQAMLPSK